MKLVFIIAIMFLGITTAQGQTALPLNGQTNSDASAVGSDPLNVPTSSLPSMSSPSPASQSGAASGSPTTTGSASGGNGGNRLRLGDLQITFAVTGGNTGHIHTGGEHDCDGSRRSLIHLLCPGPLNGWGSANLSEMAGASLGGC